MELYIGEGIKRLRREKGITQETLAEHMHISAAAISKWERGETLPDISMIIPLASYFGVSTDEILGLDAAKNEEKIKNYLDEYHRLAPLGKVHEQFELILQAYNAFPNDWRIVEEYMWQLFYDPNCSDPWGYQVHKEELYRLCDRVLDESTLDKTRYAALSILGALYSEDGKLDKAIATAKRFPDHWMTKDEELEGCYDRGSEEWYGQLRENIWNTMHTLQVKMRNAALYTAFEDPAEQIRILKKSIALIELVFDEGDFGFCHYDLGELYIWIADRYVMLDDFDAAFECYEKGLAHAREYDELPRMTTHTSFLVRGKTLDMMKTTSSSQENEVGREINYILSKDTYQKVKDMPKMQEIINKYKPFMGNKKACV